MEGSNSSRKVFRLGSNIAKYCDAVRCVGISREPIGHPGSELINDRSRRRRQYYGNQIRSPTLSVFISFEERRRRCSVPRETLQVFCFRESLVKHCAVKRRKKKRRRKVAVRGRGADDRTNGNFGKESRRSRFDQPSR